MMNAQLERIERGAFCQCSALESVRLPSKVKYIGCRAFGGCGNLKHIMYCGDTNDVDYSEGDPFPTNPSIYLLHTVKGGRFCGHKYKAILDLECNMPTNTSIPLRPRVKLLEAFGCIFFNNL